MWIHYYFLFVTLRMNLLMKDVLFHRRVFQSLAARDSCSEKKRSPRKSSIINDSFDLVNKSRVESVSLTSLFLRIKMSFSAGTCEIYQDSIICPRSAYFLATRRSNQ